MQQSPEEQLNVTFKRSGSSTPLLDKWSGAVLRQEPVERHMESYGTDGAREPHRPQSARHRLRKGQFSETSPP